MTSRGNTRLKIWLVVAGVFLLGCLTGAFLDSAYRLRARDGRHGGRGRHDESRVFEEMRRDLSLTDEQATQIRAILEQSRNEFRALRAEVRPRYDALRQNTRQRIRALLTTEQQQRFDAEAAKRDARRDRDEGGGGR